MFLFFIRLYASLMNGQWLPDTGGIPALLKTNSNYVFQNIFNFLVNALGGNYSDLTNFNIYQSMQTIGYLGENSHLICLASTILALITMCGVLLAVCKVVKSLFFIFFEGWS